MSNAILIIPVVIIVHFAFTMWDMYKEYKENNKKND